MKVTAKEITKALLTRLWVMYLDRVSYAREYQRLVIDKGGSVVNDHIAFRTFNTHTGEQPEGIRAIKHIISCLEYVPVEKYNFKKKKLNAVHFEHPDPMFPKLFVSQLEVEELPEWAQQIIKNTVKETPYLLSDESIALLATLKEKGELPRVAGEMLVNDLAQYFRRPWNVPNKDDVLKVNDVSQYAAWVLLHGNAVNHFTAFVNYQNVSEWPDLESTCKGMADAGIPMKESLEGEKGSKLQQSATLAVKEEVEVKGDDGIEKMPWTYAYYELAERGLVIENGEEKLFSGFLGEQARHLFDMTRTRDN
ncbi:DUF1338 domain-containing protein [uncultured Draconibacterium sp.]|uniref:DUF1338 domain-containing protein n=1 Tax=uncultured Draconibacterium sp. TaxID=1573823 RepID=UPI0029C7536B|nr:DUF1338 domain-containing protein [uncultured Draconibacterium sp.]